MSCRQLCGVPALTMAILVLVASCLVQHLTSGALIQDPAITEANTVKGCDSLRLARQYTYCAVPFYVDYHEKDVPEDVLCAQAHNFKRCAEVASKMSGCTNQDYPLRSTFRYYTATILTPYFKICKIDIAESAGSSPPEIEVVHTGNKSRSRVLGRRQLGEDYYHDESGRENYDYPNHPKGDFVAENVHEVHMTDNNGSNSPTLDAFADSRDSTMSFVTDGNGLRSNDISTSSPTADTRNTSEITQSQPNTASANVASPEKPAGLPPVQKLPTDLEIPGTPPTEDRGRILQATSTCGPLFNTSYKYPSPCEKKFFLRRFFTCGIHFQYELEITTNNCSCYVSYLECIKKARDELKCAQPGVDDQDPILISVKVLTELMTSIYGSACHNKTNITAFLASRSRSQVCCDEQRGLKHAVMCYATYFYLSDVRTPALWPSSLGSCSLVTDLKRCADFAQQHTECTSCNIGHHIKQFVGAVIQPHHSQCDTGETGVQYLGAYMRENCHTPLVMKRTLRCSLTFQDMIDLEGTARPQNLLCGHASRLHTCLEDTVDNTGCMNDAHVSSQVKMYKKILEDTYVVHCNVLALRERAYVREAFELAGPVSTLRDQHKSRVFVLTDADQSENDKAHNDLKQYSSLLDHAGNAVNADQSEIQVQRSKLDVEGSWEALNKLQAEKQRRNSGGRQNDQARWINRKFRSWQALKQRAGEFTSGKDNGDFGMNMMRDVRSLDGVEERAAVSGGMLLEPAREVYKHDANNVNAAENKKLGFQDDYFLENDYAEHGEMSASHGQLKQFPHLKAAVPNIQNVMQEANTTSTSYSNDTKCSQEKLHPDTRQCEDSLLTLMSRWPMKANHTLMQSSEEHGKSLVCGDIASYKECMLRALKSSGCDRQEVIQAIMKEKGSSLQFPMCSAAHRLLPELTLMGIIAGLSYRVSS